MMGIVPLEIREYRPQDRDGVRRLCVEVAVFGKPLNAWLDLDPEIYADIFTGYYTDCEPEGLFVAESRGQIIAYLAICRDAHRYRRIMNFRIIPKVVAKILFGYCQLGGRILQVGYYYFLENIKYGRILLPLEDYPAHFHFNVAEEFRRDRRIWMRLVPLAFKYAYTNGIFRIHGLGVSRRGKVEQTYSNVGFKVLARQRSLIRRNVTQEEVFWLLIGTDLKKWVESLPPAFQRLFREEKGLEEVWAKNEEREKS
jgi:hypothetical protein